MATAASGSDSAVAAAPSGGAASAGPALGTPWGDARSRPQRGEARCSAPASTVASHARLSAACQALRTSAKPQDRRARQGATDQSRKLGADVPVAVEERGHIVEIIETHAPQSAVPWRTLHSSVWPRHWPGAFPTLKWIAFDDRAGTGQRSRLPRVVCGCFWWWQQSHGRRGRGNCRGPAFAVG